MERNRRQFLLMSLLLVSIAISHSLRGQTPIWSEEFNTGTRIDPKTWIYTTGGGGFGNNELEYYTDRPENVRIENGSLVIEARRETYENRQFTSARINTLGRAAFKYATIEARIKLPNVANGLWPAFWMMGSNIGSVGWPKCGEIDILETGSAGAITAGVVNSRVGAAIHWFEDTPAPGGYASTSSNNVISGNFYDDYHLFKLEWTPTAVTISVDGTPYFVRDITAANKSEFHNYAFILLNLAVGGNYPGITSPANITAAFPGKMYVDYVRVYDNGFTQKLLAADTEKKGPFGMWTETTPVNSQVDMTKASLYVWNNMTANGGAAYEGSSVLSYHINAGAWYGMGISSTEDINLSRFANGYLHMHVKTNGTQPISFGFINSAYSVNNGESWYAFNGTEYGLIRDGQWHEVVVPMNKFDDIDFNTIKQVLTVKGAAPTAAFDLAIDNVYLTESVPLEAPQNGNFVLSSETAPRVDDFVLGTDGNLYVWENTLAPITPTPYEGTQALAYRTTLQSNVWYGFGFNPNLKYNLSAFRYSNSSLHFALKTTSTASFKIGMKSGSLPGVGLKYISFVNGSDPYGFVRDGQWHVIEIPMADYMDVVDLSNISELFMVSGGGPANDIQFDDIYFKNGGPLDPVVINDPSVSFTTPAANATLSGTVAVNALAYDPTVGTADGSGISNVLFELLNGATVVASLKENIKPYDWSLNTRLYANGTYTLRATATSTVAAGGTSTQVTIPVTISNVTGDPVVQFTTPAANATISGTTAINALAYDPDAGPADGSGISNVFFELLQGTTVRASLRENIKPYDWSLNTRTYANGAYTLRATATSTTAAGGTTKVITIPVTISNTAGGRIASDNIAETPGIVRALGVSPNPVTSVLTVELGDKKYNTLHLQDTQGRALNVLQLGEEKSVQLDVSTLHGGMYFIRLTGADVHVLKFIKQ